jgi:diacylglycerol diphosphate phosphatase/phosphatidate phosphatase
VTVANQPDPGQTLPRAYPSQGVSLCDSLIVHGSPACESVHYLLAVSSRPARPAPPPARRSILMATPQPGLHGDHAGSTTTWGSCVVQCICLALLAAVVTNDAVYASIRHEREIPGTELQLGSGTHVFVRDPSLNHPLSGETVSSSALGVVIIVGLLIFAAIERATSSVGVPYALVAWARSTVLTEFVTNAAKNYMGVLRPIFYAGCGWDDELMACTRDFATGRRSCPSGHSSHSFHLATLLTLHLIRSLDHGASRRESACWNAAPFFPGLCAMFVACSRVHDNSHHPADVVAGAALGTAIAMLSHGLSWPSPRPVPGAWRQRVGDESSAKLVGGPDGNVVLM